MRALRDERLKTYRVGRRGVDVLHDSSNTVVAPCVGTTLSAASHIGKSLARVASINHRLTGVDGLSSITVAGEAVRLVA